MRTSDGVIKDFAINTKHSAVTSTSVHVVNLSGAMFS